VSFEIWVLGLDISGAQDQGQSGQSAQEYAHYWVQQAWSLGLDVQQAVFAYWVDRKLQMAIFNRENDYV
jgi:hypothetical protein